MTSTMRIEKRYEKHPYTKSDTKLSIEYAERKIKDYIF